MRKVVFAFRAGTISPQLEPASPLGMGSIAHFSGTSPRPLERAPHLPLNTALRFSEKARTPSFESSETRARS